MKVLEGKAALVTGSARGIGRAAARLLAEQGASVMVADLDEVMARETATGIGGETAVFGGDLTKDGVCDELVASTVGAFGKLDIVVNNAGIVHFYSFADDPGAGLGSDIARARHRTSETAASAGDDRHLSVQPELVHVFSAFLECSPAVAGLGDSGAIQPHTPRCVNQPIGFDWAPASGDSESVRPSRVGQLDWSQLIG